MIETNEIRHAAFDGSRLLARGSRAEVAVAVLGAQLAGAEGPVLAFGPDGRQVDFDLRGGAAEVRARYGEPAPEPRGRGRPRLGVTAREVTLLPRHWDWLAAQPGGASVALRKLVEAASKADEAPMRARKARDAAYAFMTAMAGDLPGFEEAIRALYAGDRTALETLVADWPADVRFHALMLADPS